MNPRQVANPFLPFWELGYQRLVPVVPVGAEISARSSLNRPGSVGKAVGVRGANGKWHGFDWVPYESSEADVARWHRMGADVGIKAGPQADGSFLVWIDADTYDRDSGRVIFDAIEARWPGLPVRIGQSPKAMYPIRVSQPFRYARIEFGTRNDKGQLSDRCEILSTGKYAKVAGVHPSTMEPYRWTRPLVALSDLPVCEPHDLMTLLEDLRPLLKAAPLIREGGTAEVNQEALRSDVQTVRAIVEKMPNTSEHFGTREAYRDMAYAIKASLPDDEAAAFSIFSDWCSRWKDGENAEAVVESDFRRCRPPYRIGIGWLIDRAADVTGGAVTAADRYFDAEAAAGQLETPPPSHGEGGGAARPKLQLVSFDDAADSALTQSTKPLIKGLLDQGAMTVLYGESNAGKTFVTMDIAYHVSVGRSWGGMKVTQGAVVYIAAEGGAGARKRAAALRHRYGPSAAFHFVLSPVDLRNPDADLRPLLELLRGVGGLVLVVVDTLSRALAGADENSSVDMGAMVRHFDVMRAATGAHLIVVHHTGKDLAKGARGHSLLRAATDTEIEIVEGGISVTKQRDLEKEWSSGFALDSVTLGVTEDGDVVTSAVVSLQSAGVALAPADKLMAAVDAVRQGEWRRDQRAGESWVGVPVAMALGIALSDAAGKARVEAILVQLIKDGRLIEEIRRDKFRNSRVYVVASGSIFD